MSFKFAGTSQGNSAENYSAAVTDRYIDRRRNQRWVVTTETDRRRWMVAWLMKRTRPDPVGVYYKISPFKLPNPSFHPHSFITPPIALSFKLPQSLPLSNDHCPPPKKKKLAKALKVIIYKSELLLWVSSWSPSTFPSCFSPILRYVSLISTHLSCIFVY